MAEQKKKRPITDVEGGLPSPPNTTKQITITQPGTGQLLDTNQMDTAEAETKTNDDDVVTFKAQLNGLKGVDPIPIPLDNSLKIDEISTKMNEILKLVDSKDGALRFKKSFFAPCFILTAPPPPFIFSKTPFFQSSCFVFNYIY